MSNTQNLPAGLAGRIAQVSAPAPAAPAAVAPVVPNVQVSPIDRGPALDPNAPPAAAPVAPAAPEQPRINPMGQEAFNADAPQVPTQAPVAPQAPQQQQQAPAPKEPDGPVGSIAELAGHLAADSNVAPAVSYMEAVFKDNGVDITRALGAAADHLDATRIDVHYLKEKLGDKADQVIKLATSTLEYAATYQTESVNQVYAAAGNKEQWDLAVGAFNEKADPTERQMLADLINSGVRDKMVYAAKKIAEYGVQAGVIVRHNAPPMGQPGSMQGLSKEAYVAAISVRNLPDAKYKQLRAQRELGIQQGL